MVLLKSFKLDLGISPKPQRVGGKPDSTLREIKMKQREDRIERQSKVRLNIQGFQNVPRKDRPIKIPKLGAGFTKDLAVNKATTTARGSPIVSGTGLPDFGIFRALNNFLSRGRLIR